MSQTIPSRFASSPRKGLIGIKEAKSTRRPLSKRLRINDCVCGGPASARLDDQVWLGFPRSSVVRLGNKVMLFY